MKLAELARFWSADDSVRVYYLNTSLDKVVGTDPVPAGAIGQVCFWNWANNSHGSLFYFHEFKHRRGPNIDLSQVHSRIPIGICAMNLEANRLEVRVLDTSMLPLSREEVYAWEVLKWTVYDITLCD